MTLNCEMDFRSSASLPPYESNCVQPGRLDLDHIGSGISTILGLDDCVKHDKTDQKGGTIYIYIRNVAIREPLRGIQTDVALLFLLLHIRNRSGRCRSKARLDLESGHMVSLRITDQAFGFRFWLE